MAIQDDANNSKSLKDNLQEADKIIKNINDTSTNLRADFGAINNIFKDIKKTSVFYSDELKAAVTSTGNLEKSAAKLAQFDKEKLKDKTELANIAKEEKKVLNEITDLESQRRTLAAKKLALEGKNDKASLAELRRINKALEVTGDTLEKAEKLAGFFEDIRKTNDELNKKTEFFDKLAELADDVPVLGKFFGDFAKASEKIRNDLGSNRTEAGLRALLSLGGKAAAVTGATALATADKQITSIARNLNVSRANAAAFRGELIDAANKSGKPVGFLLEGIDAVNESLGTQGLISTDAAKQFSTLTHRLGLSTEEATNLFKASVATGKSFKEVTNDVAGQVKALNYTTGAAIDYKQVMKDIGSFSNATLLTQTKFAGGLAKAAFTARKLGLEMSGLESIAGNLLNFEESIASELEAELLTGKQLNLDNARAAALKGDMVTLAEELNAQNITADSFGKMNVLAQEAQARALGMSREEMATMLNKQEQLKKVAKELNDNTILQADTEEKIQKIMEAKNVSKSAALKMLGEEEMATQALNVEASTQLKEAAEMIKQSFKPDLVNAAITSPLQSIIGALGGVVSMMSNVAVAALAYYAIRGLSGGSFRASNLLKGGKGMFGKKGGGLTKFVDKRGVTRYRDAAGKFAKAPKAGGGMFSGLFKGGAGILGGGGLMSMVQPGISDPTPPKNIKNSADISKTVTKKAKSRAAKQTATSGAKIMGKKGVGMMFKKVPILGAIVGAGYAVSRAAQGDWLGAAGELASGIASTIPGAGTAASLAIDGALIARDMGAFGSSPGSRAGGTAADSSMSSVASATDNALKYQTKLVELMETSNELNKKMLAKNSDVNIDGQKASSILYQGTFKFG